MKRWVKVCCAVALISVMGFGTSGCITSAGLWKLGPVRKAINMDSYLSPGFARSHPTTCRTMATPRFPERCAVQYGIESDESGGWPADNRNWYIDYADDPFVNGPAAWGYAEGNPRGGLFVSPNQVCPVGVDVDGYGCTILVAEGVGIFNAFAGCEYKASGNIWFCDDAERAMAVPYSGSLDWRTVARASLDWLTYVGGNPGLCALGIVGAGFEITSAELENCGDGPYPGFGNNGQLDVTLRGDFDIPGPAEMGPQIKHVGQFIGVK